jgi:hypothetical protein
MSPAQQQRFRSGRIASRSTSKSICPDVLVCKVRRASLGCKAHPNSTGVNVPCHVQSVTVIPAEVTLVKCNVRAPAPTDRTIVVDISFKQHGGVNAAAFLEEADRFIDAYTASQQGAFQQRECEVHITALAICGVSATF